METKEEWKARIGSGPAIAASAVPTRRPEAAGERSRTKRWEQEHAAARQLKRAGIVPETLAAAPQMVRDLNA